VARLPRTVWLLGFASLLTDASTEAVYPLLPLFITTLGGGALAVGLMEGLGESVASLLKLASGRLSDKWGRRKGLAVFGYAFSALAKAGYPVAGRVLDVVLLRTTDRIGKGIRGAPRDALLADSLPRERRGYGFGVHRALDTTGAFLGPLAALLLLPLLSLRGIFAAALVPAVAGVLVLLLVRETTQRTPVALTPSLRGSLPPRFFAYLAVMAVFTLGTFGYAFLLLRGAQADLGIERLLEAQLVHTAVYALLAVPLGAITDRWGRAPVLAMGFAVLAAASLAAALTDPASVAALFAAAALFGVANAAYEGNGRALAVDLAPQSLRGTALGAYHAAIGAIALPGGLAVGFLWAFRPSLAFEAGAGLAAVAGLALLGLWARGVLSPHPDGAAS
jgi:MFS family permease